MIRVAIILLFAATGFTQGLGRWKVNLSKSTYKPGPPPLSETYTYEKAPGGQIITRVWAGRDGRHVTERLVLIFDGKWYPVAGLRHADEICSRQISDRIVVCLFKRKGEVVLTSTRVVAEDDKAVTITLDGMGVNGKIHNVRILDRQ
jgi:hypothetical protein